MNLQTRKKKNPKHMEKLYTKKEPIKSTIENRFYWKKLKYWNSLREHILDTQNINKGLASVKR